MNADDADTCTRALALRWRYQPMSDHERTAWKRYLRDVSLEDFGEALDLAVAQGGSKLASQPNQRPAVAEFAGIVNLVRSRRARETSQSEPWPEGDPAEVARHVAECREILRAKGAKV